MEKETWHELVIDEERYGKPSPIDFYPRSMRVFGTLAQARNAADLLSGREAGCDHFFIVKGDDER